MSIIMSRALSDVLEKNEQALFADLYVLQYKHGVSLDEIDSALIDFYGVDYPPLYHDFEEEMNA